MKDATRNAGVIVGGVLLVCGVTMSQVAPTQTGRVLDSSPLIGSAGYNTPTGSAAGVNSQLFVGGLVRGGVGLMQDGTLLSRNMQLGSAGYNQVRGGVLGVNTQLFINRQTRGLGLFRGQVPYDRLRSASGALKGQNLGNLGVRRLIEPALAKRLYFDATQDYASIAKIPPGKGLEAVAPLIRLDRRTGLAPKAAAAPSLPSKPGASALFGVLLTEDQLKLARQLQQLPADSRMDYRIDLRMKPGSQTTADTGTPESGEPRLTGAPPEITAKPNLDVFRDILRELEDLRSKPSAGEETAEATAAAAGNLVETSKTDNIVLVRSLAGRSRNTFNIYLEKGQLLLKKEKYYSAADHFELATIVSPGNPLARIGFGLALLGAGEPLSAARQFRVALALYEPLMGTSFDFAEMSSAEHLATRTTELNERINTEGDRDPMLIFLATYLHFNARRAEDSKSYARKLAKVAGGDRFLATYANFVLTGKRTEEAGKKAEKKNQK